MKVIIGKSKKIGIIIICLFGLLFITGYRLTGIQSAKGHFDIGKEAQLVGQVPYKWGTVYLFKTPNGYRTAMAEKKGLLWRTKIAFHMNDNSDSIKVVGWGSRENATVYAVEVNDDEVSYIEIGSDSDRSRKYTNESKTIIFSWDKAVRWNDFNGIAYSKEGKAIYEYRYSESTNYQKPEDLKWYRITK